MAQVQARVVTCVAGTPQYDGAALSTGVDPVSCLLPDGVHYGRPVIVDAYLSDQPIVADSSSGGGACTNPFSMSAEDGGLLSAAIVGCWAAAYFVRSVINVVKNGVES